MIEIRPVSPSDFDHIRPRSIYSAGAARSAKGAEERSDASFAILFEGRLLGLFFGSLIFTGSMHAWALTTDIAEEKKLLFVKTLKTLVATTAASHGLHRMQMTVKADSPYGDWPRLLGFNSEGTLKRYDSEAHDYKLFARIF